MRARYVAVGMGSDLAAQPGHVRNRLRVLNPLELVGGRHAELLDDKAELVERVLPGEERLRGIDSSGLNLARHRVTDAISASSRLLISSTCHLRSDDLREDASDGPHVDRGVVRAVLNEKLRRAVPGQCGASGRPAGGGAARWSRVKAGRRAHQRVTTYRVRLRCAFEVISGSLSSLGRWRARPKSAIASSQSRLRRRFVGCKGEGARSG